MKLILSLLMVGILALGGEAATKRKLLKDYRGTVVLPEDLYQTFERLVDAFEKGKQQDIEKFCIPGKVKIITKPRAQAKREYGADINLPYLKNGFHKYPLVLRKDSNTEYLIRTGSTALWFTKTDKGEWKLSKYFDKPIQ